MSQWRLDSAAAVAAEMAQPVFMYATGPARAVCVDMHSSAADLAYREIAVVEFYDTRLNTPDR